jgi:RhtB (resistance to homoserine/threonine) family protein
VPHHLLIYIGVVVAVALLPGADTAVITKNALMYGRDAALGSAIGVNVGLAVWTVATALGVAAVIRSSGTVYDTLKLIGAVYLIWIGGRTLWDSRRVKPGVEPKPAAARKVDRRGGFRQGVISNLANPKVGIFFTSLLPQFVSSGSPALPQLLTLGAIVVAVNLVWICSYALAAVRLSEFLSRKRVKAALDRFTGLLLVGLGIRLAVER